MGGGIYGAVMEQITWHTGLSPAAFFTIAGMMVLVYNLVSAYFVGPEDYNKPPVAATIDATSNLAANNYLNLNSTTTTTPTQMGDMTEQQLRGFDGSDSNKPLLMAIRGQIYDVSSSRNFYGPGGPYAMFAGRDASRALALLSFKPQDINGNIEGLGPDELEILQDWEDKFVEKYVKVGQLVAGPANTEQSEGGDEAQPQGIEQAQKRGAERRD